MIDAHDDLASAKPPYRVIACLAVLGRRPLLEHTITRLYKKNGCYKVICSGDNPEDMAFCKSLGAVWVHGRNKPLGNKWNQSFLKAKEYSPDACLFVGSSDWVSDDWISIMRPHVDKHGFAGVPGCHLLDVGETLRLCHWKGYKGYRDDRASESIGIGRMLSRRLLDAIDWLPFNPDLDNSLDWSMKKRSEEKGFTDSMVNDFRLKALSLSTDLWLNKHRFWMHWNDREDGTQLISSEKIPPDAWVKTNFPEALIFQEQISENIKLYANFTGVRK